jgi:ferredoxin
MMRTLTQIGRTSSGRLKRIWKYPTWYLWVPVAHLIHWCMGFSYYRFQSKQAVYAKARDKLLAAEGGTPCTLDTADLRDALAGYMPPKIPFDVAFARASDLTGRFGEQADWRYSPMLSRYQLSFNGAPSRSVIVFTMFSDVAPDFYNEAVAENLCAHIDKVAGTKVAVQDLAFLHAKEFAVAAGLGVIGKNALFFSRKFGFNCKISVILLHADLTEYSPIPSSSEALAPDQRTDWKLDACLSCDICVRACPVGAYDEFRMNDPIACERVISRDFFGHRRLKICHTCMASCPVSNELLQDIRNSGVPRYKFWDHDRQLNALADLIYRPSFFTWVIQRFYFGAGIPGVARKRGKTIRGQQAGREGVPNSASEANNGWIDFIRTSRPAAGEHLHPPH